MKKRMLLVAVLVALSLLAGRSENADFGLAGKWEGATSVKDGAMDSNNETN